MEKKKLRKDYSQKIIHSKSARFLYGLIKPKSNKENLRRREFIFNILILGAIILFALMAILAICHSTAWGDGYNERGVNPEIILFLLAIFLFLYILSRAGYFTIASHIFIALYFIPNTFMIYRWGAELPTGLLLYALIIIMSGILINTRYAFFITFLASFLIISIGYLQIKGIIEPNLYWKNENMNGPETIVFSAILAIIALVAWLSNREIEKSLNRARKSEAELKEERNLLEIKVEKRTKELKIAQMEKITQLYRLAEFGRLSSGLFHDLVNPLTAVSLNLEQMKKSTKEINDARSNLEQAVSAIHRMEDFIIAVRKQIQMQKTKNYFSLIEEIIQAIQILSYKARKAGVSIIFIPIKEIKTFGDSIKFNQVISNLISNAIDAYDNKKNNKKKIKINLYKKDGQIYLTIKDQGCGVPRQNLEKIFEPFFTTKDFHRGTGIGLSSTKNIIEKDFKGIIKVKSELEKGTKFIIKIPANKKQALKNEKGTTKNE